MLTFFFDYSFIELTSLKQAIKQHSCFRNKQTNYLTSTTFPRNKCEQVNAGLMLLHRLSVIYEKKNSA